MLRRFLPQVLAATDASVARVVVTDNGSTDGSLEVLAREFPAVDVVRFDENYGFAEGYNRAIAAVSEPYVVLLNSDVAATAGWVEALLAHMESNPQCGACQPKILSVDNPDYFEYAGACGGFIDRNGYPFCRGRIFGTLEPDRGQYDAAMSVDWASGAALMVRRELYLKAGGLDSKFFAHMEEIDLCWRLRSLGFMVDAVPAARVYHLGGGSLPMGNPRKTYLNFRNNLLLLHKNLPAKDAPAAIRRRKILDGIAAVKFLLSADFKGVKAIYKAHRDFNEMKKEYPLNHHINENLIINRPNILSEYYLKHNKYFSSIKHL